MTTLIFKIETGCWEWNEYVSHDYGHDDDDNNSNDSDVVLFGRCDTVAFPIMHGVCELDKWPELNMTHFMFGCFKLDFMTSNQGGP